MLRYGLLQGTEPQTVFAKLYRGNHGERAFGIANQLSAWLGAHGNGIVAVKPLAYLAAEGVILYPCVSGKPLSRYLSRHLSRSGASVAGYLQLAGQALRLVHCAPQALADAVEHHSFEDDVRAILRAGQHLDAVGPQLGAAAAAIVDRARAVHQRLGQEPAGPPVGAAPPMARRSRC